MTNTTHAVRAQRHEAHDSLDDFPTPPWAFRGLLTHALPVVLSGADLRALSVWEPAANRGHTVAVLREFFGAVVGSDIHDYGAAFTQHDFLMPYLPAEVTGVDMVITNPPFRLAVQFVRRAMQVSRIGCAVLVRGTWVETIERYEMFREIPPALIAQFAERVPMVKGRVDPDASTATAYAWVVFLHGWTGMTWWMPIPPCRKTLERAGDYPSAVVQAASLPLLDGGWGA